MQGTTKQNKIEEEDWNESTEWVIQVDTANRFEMERGKEWASEESNAGFKRMVIDMSIDDSIENDRSFGSQRNFFRIC